MAQKRILCFGDSNTYGYSAETGISRYDEHTRWTMRLQKLLGEEFTVLEEGLNGRTTIFDDPVEGGYKSALDYLPPCLMSHTPLYAVVLMLGTNDSKERFSMNSFTISQCVARLIDLIRQYSQDVQGGAPHILLVSPIEIGDFLIQSEMVHIFGEKSIETSKGFAAHYEKVAADKHCLFLDAAKIASPAPEDAIHLTRAGHAHLAQAISEKILAMRGGSSC